jgi:hypothetical protein
MGIENGTLIINALLQKHNLIIITIIITTTVTYTFLTVFVIFLSPSLRCIIQSSCRVSFDANNF